ncbi:MAG: LysM peptidoglycan-binding domain-containing protein [Thermoguttaceae bacterium]|nr:LysM peptidoglycan-binding domain-containing protein [Thermoguttaceae bacterium]
MLGKLLNGVAICAALGLATVGGLTFVPDKAWESFPPALAPARAQFAKYGIAPTKYIEESIGEPVVASESESEKTRDEEPEGARSRLSQFDSKVLVGGRAATPDYDPDRESPGKSSHFDATALTTPTPSPSEPSRTELGRADSDPRRFAGTTTVSEVAEPRVDTSLADAAFADAPSTDPLSPESSAVLDEPRIESPESLDALLSDRDALDSPSAKPANSAFPESAPIAADSPYSDPLYASDPVETPGAPAPSAEPETIDPPIIASPLRSQEPENLGEQQGYLPASIEVAGSLPPATSDALAPSQGQNQVQSFDDYLQSRGASSSPASQEIAAAPPAEQALVPETNFVQNAPNAGLADVETALELVGQGRTDDQTLSIFATLNRFRDSRLATLTPAELARVNAALDRLAYEIFYDPNKSIIEPARQVKRGETLSSIARELDVAPQTLAEINNISGALDLPLPEGSYLKVFRGPVTAEISASRLELLLRINGYYAGRFPAGIPRSALGFRGKVALESKLANPSCDAVDSSGNKLTIPGGSENNPLGARWLGLDNGLGLQGTNRPSLVGTVVNENGGVVFSNEHVAQLDALLPVGASVYFVD